MKNNFELLTKFSKEIELLTEFFPERSIISIFEIENLAKKHNDLNAFVEFLKENKAETFNYSM